MTYNLIPETSEDGTRFYRVEGTPKKHISVTTLIGKYQNKEALFKWRERVGAEEATRVAQKASSRGTKVHKHIENYYVNGLIPPDNIEDKNLIFFNKLLPVVKNITPLIIEDELGIEKTTHWENEYGNGFAGSVDICGTLLNDSVSFRVPEERPVDEYIPFIGDWKTWNKVKSNKAQNANGENWYPLIAYSLQLSAYCAAVNQRTNNVHRLNKAFIFGVTENCRQPFIYYFNPAAINFYWANFKKLIEAYYNNGSFDWKQFEREADRGNHLGTRVDLI
jgi:genome maintenance exonuclease 1